MAITISTHNGSVADLAHNLREPWRIEQENKKWADRHNGELRIDLSKDHEVLVNRGTLSQVYHRLFDDALKTYNEKQISAGKSDRVIKNYLSTIRAKEGSSKAAKHPIYEMITQIGSKDNPIPDDVAEKILREHAAGFEQRNPHLYVVCQVLHSDETGGIHVHTDYIPVATDQKRGMHTQNSLSAALKQQGILSDKYSATAQMAWEKRENQALEEICKRYGYEVKHPQAGTDVEHLSVEEYRLQKQIEEKQESLDKITDLPAGIAVVKKAKLDQLEETVKKYETEKPLIEEAKRSLKSASESMQAVIRKQERLDQERRNFDKTVNDEVNRRFSVIRDHSDKAMAFIIAKGLFDEFRAWIQSITEKVAAKLHI